MDAVRKRRKKKKGVDRVFCFLQKLRNFYIATVGLIFVVCLVLQIPRLNVPTYMKTLTFVLWAAFGIIPTAHWAVIMGGFENAMVRVSCDGWQGGCPERSTGECMSRATLPRKQ